MIRAKSRRIRVISTVDPIAPMGVLRALFAMARLTGADEIWMADHAKSPVPESLWTKELTPLARILPNPNANFDPFAIASRFAGRGRLPLGIAVTDGIRRSAADLAREWLTIHHLTGGRVIFGIGAGEGQNFLPYGYPGDRPMGRLEDLVKGVREAWESQGAPVDAETPFRKWTKATFALPPYRGTFPPIYVAAQGPRGSGVAGRYADGWIAHDTGMDNWDACRQRFVQGAYSEGRDPNALERVIVVPCLAVGSDADFEAICRQDFVRMLLVSLFTGPQWAAAGFKHPFGADFHFIKEDTSTLSRERLFDASRAVTPQVIEGLLRCGSANHIVSALRPYIDAGVTRVALYNMANVYVVRNGLARTMREQRRLIRRLKQFEVNPLDTSVAAPVIEIVR